MPNTASSTASTLVCSRAQYRDLRLQWIHSRERKRVRFPERQGREESKRCFGQGLSALEASKKIDFGPYGGWKAPARLFINVERAYREFRNEATDAPWDRAKIFDAVLAVAKAKGIEVEF
ncbi:MAG: hypothetical protein JNK99_07725 [Candidatus Accumulibacter sp.]|uniref:hypothetical protein n=1 Tax=Accumulibacter sp. TaxID=2053492 RepID=UPI001A3FA357|nr:hypothetical protein [Accumulibacter sp.]MBL8394622.1 hypothetical protein [Accumulibacter sp.]